MPQQLIDIAALGVAAVAMAAFLVVTLQVTRRYGQVLVRLRCGVEIETVTVGVEEVDEAGMDGACIREQAHNRVEHLLEVERGPHRRDDIGEESLPAPLYVTRRGYVQNRTRGGVENLHS